MPVHTGSLRTDAPLTHASSFRGPAAAASSSRAAFAAQLRSCHESFLRPLVCLFLPVTVTCRSRCRSMRARQMPQLLEESCEVRRCQDIDCVNDHPQG